MATGNGRNARLSSHLPWADPRRGWDFVSVGLGDVPWGPLFSALTDTGYQGPVCIEVEDRAFEGSLADRRRSLRQSKRFLKQFIG